MDRQISGQFQVKALQEGNYNRLYVTHPAYKGRIKKRIHTDITDDKDVIANRLKCELETYFIDKDITSEAVAEITENFVSRKLRVSDSMFNYFDDFLEWKKTAVNKRTKGRLVKSTITSYKSAKRLFEEYLSGKGIKPCPQLINQEVLDNFYYHVKGKHNYKVKQHRRIKAFFTYLGNHKGIQCDPSFKTSVFVEEYDNQEPKADDIALTADEVRRLIALRKQLHGGNVDLPKFKPNNHFPENIQRKQYEIKKSNLVRCLDCFLFMCSTGQYHSDISKTSITLTKQGSLVHLKYRRAKNGSLCKGIPVSNDDIFIAAQIIDDYKIKSGSNFPLNLSNTHFVKHLEIIGELAGFNFKLTNKTGRKSFASILYFDRQMPIHLLQIMLGHKNVNNTMHYLRVTDENLVNEINRIMCENR